MPSPSDLLILGGPAGGQNPDGSSPVSEDHTWPVETEGNTSLENKAGENRAARVNELFGGRMSLWTGYLKIFRNPVVRTLRRRDLKLFQIKARSMVHTGSPGQSV